MSRALGEQDGSHHDIFKCVTNAKCPVFMLDDSVANTNRVTEDIPKELARLLTAAVARTLANVN